MIRCSQCNSELTDNDKFCYKCGAKISKEAFCPNCGTKTNPDSAFCPNCGTPLSNAPADKQTATTPTAEQSAKAPAEPTATTPAKPTATTPAEPTATTPAKTAATTPAKTAAPNPKTRAASAPAGKKKSPWKAILFSVLGAAVVAALVFAFVMFFNGEESNDSFALYMKDGEFYLDNLENDSEAFRLTSRLIDDDDITDADRVDIGYSLYRYTSLSEDGKYVFFPDRADLNNFYGGFDRFPLCYRETDNANADAIEIDSDIAGYFVNTSATLVTYLKLHDDNSYGDIYQYKIGKDEKEKIASDVSNFEVSADGKKICYLTIDDDLYLTGDGREKEKIASDVELYSSSPIYVTEDFSTIYYASDASLYKWVKGGNAEKIASDVDRVIKAYDSGEIYYLKIGYNKDYFLSDFVIDDMWEADAEYLENNWEYPSAPAFPDADDYSTVDAYYAAYEAYEAEYRAYMETCDRINAAYEAALARNELREELDEEALGESFYSLYFYNGSEEILVTYNCIEEVSYADESPVLAYVTYEPTDSEKIKLSEIDIIYGTGSVHVMIDEVIRSSTKTYIAVGETAARIDTDGLVLESDNTILNSSGTVAYTIAYDWDYDILEYGDLFSVLYRTDISNGGIEKTEIYDSGVGIYSNAFFRFINDSSVAYAKNSGDVSSEQYDLYVDGNKIGSNIYYYTHSTSASYDKGAILYQADFNYDDDCGTLYFYDGKDTTKLADNAYYIFKGIFPDNRVIYMSNYSSWRGELYEWHNGETRKLGNDIMFAYPVFGDHFYRGVYDHSFSI